MHKNSPAGLSLHEWYTNYTSATILRSQPNRLNNQTKILKKAKQKAENWEKNCTARQRIMSNDNNRINKNNLSVNRWISDSFVRQMRNNCIKKSLTQPIIPSQGSKWYQDPIKIEIVPQARERERRRKKEGKKSQGWWIMHVVKVMRYTQST